jgi:hypothetical protein
MASSVKEKRRPHLSILALLSFMVSFVMARVFTILNPNVVLVGGNFHIHHFWYGLALLSVGGWLGISYTDEEVDRLAAVLFGAGGGLIGDEIGLLLTFGEYWTGLTYMLLIFFLTLVSIVILFIYFSKIINLELTKFLRHRSAIYSGIFLVVFSMAFIIETENLIIMTILFVLLIAALSMIFVSLILERRK